MSEDKAKIHRCRYSHPSLDGSHKCIRGAKTIGDIGEHSVPVDKEKCENCEFFESRYIEYPVTINGITYGNITPWNVKPVLVKVRVCSREEEEKTYLGMYLGEFPHFPHASLSEEGVLTFGVSCNPCIYVPELNKVVWGCESWWSKIESPEELKEISDEDIENTWYVKLLKVMEEKDG